MTIGLHNCVVAGEMPEQPLTQLIHACIQSDHQSILLAYCSIHVFRLEVPLFKSSRERKKIQRNSKVGLLLNYSTSLEMDVKRGPILPKTRNHLSPVFQRSWDHQPPHTSNTIQLPFCVLRCNMNILWLLLRCYGQRTREPNA
jgi:hypothetical protein